MATNDSALLGRWIREQDADAFTEIVSRHSAMVYATCCRILLDAAEAEDVTQECFLKLTTFKRPRRQSLGGLLHTLATREALNRLKSLSRKAAREERYASNVPDEPQPHWDDISKLVDAAIARLPERLQFPLVAYFLEGRTQVAIAEELNLDESTVRYRIRKGLGQVRTFLKKRGIAIGAGAFASLLTSNASHAAPATLSTTLGKMAIAGAHTAPMTISSTTVLTTLGGTVLMAKKIALISVAVAIVVAAGYGGLKLQSTEDKSEPTELAVAVPNTDAEAPPAEEDALDDLGIGTGNSATLFGSPVDVDDPDSAPGEVPIESGDSPSVPADAPIADPTAVASSDVPTDNGMHYFLLAAEMFDQDSLEYISEKWKELGSEGWRDPGILVFILAHQDAFDAIRKGLEVGNAMLPFFEDAWSEPLPYLKDWRALARLMTMEASMRASQGDYAFAFEQYLTLIEFGNESSTGGSAINGLVGYVIRNVSVAALREALSSQAVSPADYAGLIEELFALNEETFAVILGETENLDLWLDDSEDPMREFIQVSDQLGTPFDVSMYSDVELALLWQEFLEHREIPFDYAGMPYYEFQAVDFDAIYGENPFSQLLLPSYERMAAATANSNAQILGTALVAAIEWYRSDEGVYPSALSQLSPQYIPLVPADPFTGSDFIFSSDAAGYVLYSTGRDMTDDGGVPLPPGSVNWVDGTDILLHNS